MRHVCAPIAPIALSVSLLAATPAFAQDEAPNSPLDFFGQGAQEMLEGLLDEMRPMLEDMQPFVQDEIVPMLQRLGELVDDLSAYDLPERLPNGDIILRRSPDAPPFDPGPETAPEPDALPEVGEHGDVEL